MKDLSSQSGLQEKNLNKSFRPKTFSRVEATILANFYELNY